MQTRRDILAGLGAAATLTIAPRAGAQGWPGQPITLVVMYGQGGGTDTIMRTLAAEMAAAKGWTINVVNKPGAVGAVATEYVAGREADGHVLLGAANFNKFVRVMGHVDAKPWEQWSYLQAASALGSWAVPVDSPFETLQDVIDAARAEPGRIAISTSGTGGVWHELALIVADAAGIELAYVPYKGGKAATLAGLQGEVDVAGGGVHEHVDLIRAGQLRCLQQMGTEDIVLDDGQVLPSVGGLLPSLAPLLPLGPQYNLVLRRDTPPAVMAEIEEAFAAAVASDAFQQIAASKYFNVEMLTGEAADRRAAQLEAITAATFTKYADKIGAPVRSPAELDLPEPAAFDGWWPPQGYTPPGT
ncbi:Bug family tripartite tricarboxylate transporter substrate binding protein [Jannaschia aquimarina]|uniref:Tripartite tricarboxylate transporter family receptor n=1 Tax=Jannaschia aquimarina TaxID=935700 RepID=A0A0D1DC48_9RHOB|nr:tripartite tricarboxylate transporter substrate-binding protein [Jannaschia aquimarina]KIT17583.1 Tripartite tricarboxylate transporter family receptor [Jannaschia aquimarina]SNS72214.1 Tripartite-type tricarboxylate transporter, receptor component TctC [Jannaschia aquimarina]